VLITLIVNAKKKIAQDVHITAPGVFEDSEDKDILDAIKVNVVNTLSSLHTLDKSRIKSSIESSVKKHIYKLIGKNPLICTSVIVI
jgi:mRNA degradation ribonuclease J1/J2